MGPIGALLELTSNQLNPSKNHQGGSIISQQHFSPNLKNEGNHQQPSSLGICRGLIGPKNLGDFWVSSLIFNGILMPNWGFNYSKMPKYRFLIDSYTFLTILGTSKILSKSGPVTLPIGVNLLLKIQEKI